MKKAFESEPEFWHQGPHLNAKPEHEPEHEPGCLNIPIPVIPPMPHLVAQVPHQNHDVLRAALAHLHEKDEFVVAAWEAEQRGVCFRKIVCVVFGVGSESE